MQLLLMARPTASSLPWTAAVSVQVLVAGGQGIGDDLLGLLGGNLETPNPGIGICTPLLHMARGISMDMVKPFCVTARAVIAHAF
jgi:hypothetical protein